MYDGMCIEWYWREAPGFFGNRCFWKLGLLRKYFECIHKWKCNMVLHGQVYFSLALISYTILHSSMCTKKCPILFLKPRSSSKIFWVYMHSKMDYGGYPSMGFWNISFTFHNFKNSKLWNQNYHQHFTHSIGSYMI